MSPKTEQNNTRENPERIESSEPLRFSALTIEALVEQQTRWRESKFASEEEIQRFIAWERELRRVAETPDSELPKELWGRCLLARHESPEALARAQHEIDLERLAKEEVARAADFARLRKEEQALEERVAKKLARFEGVQAETDRIREQLEQIQPGEPVSGEIRADTEWLPGDHLIADLDTWNNVPDTKAERIKKVHVEDSSVSSDMRTVAVPASVEINAAQEGDKEKIQRGETILVRRDGGALEFWDGPEKTPQLFKKIMRPVFSKDGAHIAAPAGNKRNGAPIGVVVNGVLSEWDSPRPKLYNDDIDNRFDGGVVSLWFEELPEDQRQYLMVDTQFISGDRAQIFTCTWYAKSPFKDGSYRDYFTRDYVNDTPFYSSKKPLLCREPGRINTPSDAYRLLRYIPRPGYFTQSADKTKTITTFPKSSLLHPAELVVGFGVENRKIRIACRGVQSESFSPDSKHYTAAILKKPGAFKKSKWRILIDGHEVGDWFDDIQSLQFSEDSSRIRFAGRKGSQWTRVVRLVSELVLETEVSSDGTTDVVEKKAA